MLRCIFVGSPNRFTDLIVHWLSERTNLVGTVWTYSAEWAKSFPTALRFARRRLHRFGLAKTIDEACYYWVARNILKDNAEGFQTRLHSEYVRVHGAASWTGDSIETNDINTPDVVQFVRQRTPDLIMSMCINEFFKKDIREVPRLGSFLWHEGIVPEYKGLYSPFWAVHNREPELLGYTVLRMNSRYDEGEVFVQGPVTEINSKTDSPLYIGHKAVLDSLPGVGVLLQELELGTAKPISTAGRVSGTYTYPGLTDWIRLKIRNRARRDFRHPQGRDSVVLTNLPAGRENTAVGNRDVEMNYVSSKIDE